MKIHRICILTLLMLLCVSSVSFGATISSIGPDGQGIGENITIVGTGFGAAQGSSYVKMGGLKFPVSSTVSWANTSITVTIPSGTHQGDTYVVVGGINSNAVNYTIDYRKALSGFKVSDPTIFAIKDIGYHASAHLVEMEENWLYVYIEGPMIATYDISTLPPTMVSYFAAPGRLTNFDLKGDYLYALGSFGMEIYKTSDLKAGVFTTMQNPAIAGYTGTLVRGFAIHDFSGTSFPTFNGVPINKTLIALAEFEDPGDSANVIIFLSWDETTETLEYLTTMDDANLDNLIVFTAAFWPNATTPKMEVGTCNQDVAISGMDCRIKEYNITNLNSISYVGYDRIDTISHIITDSIVYGNKLWISLYGKGSESHPNTFESPYVGLELSAGSPPVESTYVKACSSYLSMGDDALTQCDVDTDCTPQQQCVNGWCMVMLDCNTTSDCPLGDFLGLGLQECVDGWCQVPCTSNTQCKWPMMTSACNPFNGNCECMVDKGYCTLCRFEHLGGAIDLVEGTNLIVGSSGMSSDAKEKHDVFLWDATLGPGIHYPLASAETNDWGMDIAGTDGMIAVSDEWTNIQLFPYDTSPYFIHRHPEPAFNDPETRIFSPGWSLYRGHPVLCNGRVYYGEMAILGANVYDLGNISEWYNYNQENVPYAYGMGPGDSHGNYMMIKGGVENFLTATPGMWLQLFYQNPINNEMKLLNIPENNEYLQSNPCTADDPGWYAVGEVKWVEDNVVLAAMGNHGFYAFYVVPDNLEGISCIDDSACGIGKCIGTQCQYATITERTVGVAGGLECVGSLVQGAAVNVWDDIEFINDVTFAAGNTVLQSGILATPGQVDKDWGGLYFFDLTYEDNTPPSPSGDPTNSIYINPNSVETKLNCTLGLESKNVYGQLIGSIDAIEEDGEIWLLVVSTQLTEVIPNLAYTAKDYVMVFKYSDVPDLNDACLVPTSSYYSQANCEAQIEAISILDEQFVPATTASTRVAAKFWYYNGRPHVVVTRAEVLGAHLQDYYSGIYVFDVDNPLTPEFDTDNIKNNSVYFLPTEGGPKTISPIDYTGVTDLNTILPVNPVALERLDNGDLLVFGIGPVAYRVGTPETTTCSTNEDCGDGLYCNGTETCTAGECFNGTPIVCNDGVACTVDTCNEVTDTCQYIPNHSSCSDGFYCTGIETCDVSLGCQSGTPINCNDGISCTTDSCNEAADACDNIPNHGACSDGLWCDGDEVCDLALGCISASTRDCNDSNACTTDSCNEGTDSCDNVCSATIWSDPCCSNAACIGEPICGGTTCITDADCTDDLWCTGIESCVDDVCVAGTPPICDDGVACTVDVCDDDIDDCVSTPNNGLCDDALYCNGDESCSAVLGCVAGIPIDCFDSNSCTTDSCNESTDSCDNVCNAQSSGSSCCSDPACATFPTCLDIPEFGGLVCTDDCFIFSENFDDQSLNQPQFGTMSLVKSGGAEATLGTDYTLDTFGSGEYGYCMQAADSVPMYLYWNIAGVDWPSDELYLSFDVKVTLTVTETDEKLTLVDIGFGGGSDYLRIWIKQSNYITYSIGINGIKTEYTEYVSNLNNGTWKNIKVYIRFSDGRIKVYVNDALEINKNLGVGAWSGKNFTHISFLGNDYGKRSIFRWALDAVQIWICPNVVPCSYTSQCTDNLYCNGAELCVDGGCVNGEAPNCNDGIACTVDSCNETSNRCDNIKTNSLCDDGSYCTTDTCGTSGCAYVCAAVAPLDNCCDLAICSGNTKCIASGNLLMYEDFDDQYVDTPLVIEKTYPREQLEEDVGFTYKTGYGGTGYSLGEGTYHAPFATYYYEPSITGTTWPSDAIVVSYQMQFPDYRREWINDYIALGKVVYHPTPPASQAFVELYLVRGYTDRYPSAVQLRAYDTNGNMFLYEVVDLDVDVCDGEWHQVEFYIYHSTSYAPRIGLWVDGVRVYYNEFSGTTRLNRRIHYILIPGGDDPPIGIFTRRIDNIELWNTYPKEKSECVSDSGCDDGDVCTTDSCVRGGCYHIDNSVTCNDGDECTTGDVCIEGTCQGYPIDADGDGHEPTECGGDDCDDTDNTVYLGAAELCDGKDNACGGSIPSNEADVDDDGYRICENDCNDGVAAINPGVTEGPLGDPTCTDGLDNDCDSLIDIQESACKECTVNSDCVDDDVCTYDSCVSYICYNPYNTAPCDDLNACTLNEACKNGVCTASGEILDADGDGFPAPGCGGGATEDCDDDNALRYPGAIEGPPGDPTCSDLIDNNCNGLVDGADYGCVSSPSSTFIIMVQ